MSEKEKILTWDDITVSIKKMEDVVHKSKIEYDCIIGIAKGGLVPAAILGNLLNLPVFSIGLRSYTIREQKDIVVYQNIGHELKSKKVLLLDDINDTGKTFKFIESYLKDRHVDTMNFMCCIQKKHTIFDNCYATETVPDDTWIIFPWEIGKD